MVPYPVSAFRRMPRRFLLVFLSLLVSMSGLARAYASDVELTLVGPPGSDQVFEFTMDDLLDLPQVTIVTESEFSDTAVSYTGPLVRDLLAHTGIEGADTVRFTAVNDYYVDIPTTDFKNYEAVLALEADGERLSRREKGPIWLMYPISDHGELRSEVYNSRLIWQVVRIEAL